MAALVISGPFVAYVFLVLGIVFALLFLLTFTVMSDGESDITDPTTLDVQNHKGDQ